MWLAALLACTPSPEAPEAIPEFRPGESFFSEPWPSDTRRRADGTLVLDGFPNPVGADLIRDYVARAESLTGFGTSSPIYLPFEVPPDEVLLPTPADSVADDSPLRLFVIDGSDPDYGEAVPVYWRVEHDETSWIDADVLAVAPYPGFPLHASSRYALLVTTQIAQQNQEIAARLEEGHPEFDPGLAGALFAQGLRADDVAMVTTFTTSDPLAEMARIASFLKRDVAPAELDAEPIELLFPHEHYDAWRTHYRSPVFTHGERPYFTEGGQFEWRDDGTPRVASWDDMRLAVCAPRAHFEPPDAGWPVVLFVDGTGSEYRSFCNSDAAFEVANRLGAAGFVGLGIDLPLHGTRVGESPASDLAHFNVLNPDSGLTNFRQGAADFIYLARSVAARQQVFRAPDGTTIALDPDNVYAMGHSQGALQLALAAPFLAPDAKGAMLSGSGGILAITLTLRTDPLDMAEVIKALLQFDEGEELTVFHPSLAIIQTLAEVVDPIAYAPHWFSRRGNWRDHEPIPVFLTNGTLDSNTPYPTAVALAAAGRLPQIEPPASDTLALDMLGLDARPIPQSDNSRMFDGEFGTSGFAQYLDGSHFVIYEIEQAADLYVNWFVSSTQGRAVLWAPEEEVP